MGFWRPGLQGESFHLLILVLLMFSSANANLLHSVNEFRGAAIRLDVERLRYTAGRAVLHAGKVILLCFAAQLLKRVVSVHFIFILA